MNHNDHEELAVQGGEYAIRAIFREREMSNEQCCLRGARYRVHALNYYVQSTRKKRFQQKRVCAHIHPPPPPQPRPHRAHIHPNMTPHNHRPHHQSFKPTSFSRVLGNTYALRIYKFGQKAKHTLEILSRSHHTRPGGPQSARRNLQKIFSAPAVDCDVRKSVCEMHLTHTDTEHKIKNSQPTLLNFKMSPTQEAFSRQADHAPEDGMK